MFEATLRNKVYKESVPTQAKLSKVKKELRSFKKMLKSHPLGQIGSPLGSLAAYDNSKLIFGDWFNHYSICDIKQEKSQHHEVNLSHLRGIKVYKVGEEKIAQFKAKGNCFTASKPGFLTAM